MVSRARRHLRQNALSWVAIFIALGGTSYAAVRLPASSVGARELKTGAVTASEVRNGSLTRREFRRGALPAGPQGERGEPGPAGPRGDKGDPGATNVVVREGPMTIFEPSKDAVGFAHCQPGERATGGGIHVQGQDALVQTSRPLLAGDGSRTPVGWHGRAEGTPEGNGPEEGWVYAICVSP